MEPAVGIKDLSYRYRGQEKPALEGEDEGEFVVVMGPSEPGGATQSEPSTA